MNDRNRAAVGMVYPIADTLQMNLMMNVKKFHNSPDEISIHGDQKIALPVCNGVEFSTLLEIKASNVSPQTSWVLMKVSGYLWVLLAYLKEDDSLYFWLIDALRIKESDRPKTGGMYKGGKSIAFLTERLQPGALRIYKRKRDEAEWKLIQEMPKEQAAQPAEDPDAIGVSGPLSPGEAAKAARPDCGACEGIGWVEDKDSPNWNQCEVCGGEGKLPLAVIEEESASGTGEIDTGEICPKCEHPRFHAEAGCSLGQECHYAPKLVTVIIKLKPGQKAPDYVKVRSVFGSEIVTADVAEEDLVRLGQDPAVLSFKGSEALQTVEVKSAPIDPSGTL